MTEIFYTVERSDRKTILLQVRNGKVTVRAPYGIQEETIQRFVSEKRDWIRKKLSFCSDTSDRFSSITGGGYLLDAGNPKKVIYGVRKNAETSEVFYLNAPKSVRTYFIKSRGWILAEIVHSFAESMNLFPSDVVLYDFKAKWGSCDSRGVIKLNWRVLMLPVALRDYIIIHELCHMFEMNHSSRFWARVCRYCPDYREKRRSLKEYDFLTEMYRQKI